MKDQRALLRGRAGVQLDNELRRTRVLMDAGRSCLVRSHQVPTSGAGPVENTFHRAQLRAFARVYARRAKLARVRSA